MERYKDVSENVEVIPVVDHKPISGDLAGDLLSIISLKDPAEHSGPDGIVKRNSFRDLHRPDISQLDWVSQCIGDDEVNLVKLFCFPLTFNVKGRMTATTTFIVLKIANL